VTPRHVTFGWLDTADAGTWVDDARTWVSAERAIPFGATALVASWHATTPAGSWVEVAVRGAADGDGWSPWLELARWTSDVETMQPTSVPGQAAEHVRVHTDEVAVDEAAPWTRVQARVRLRRTDGTPELHRIGVMASRVPAEAGPASAPALGRAVTLDVPPHSQMLHRDRHLRFGGGQGWCSPTSVSMVLDHFGVLPDPDAYAWVDDGPDRFVVHGARRCFDQAYDGTGNWSFNVAYAAGQGLEAFVTRLRSLAEAERLVAAGIPLVISASFTADELTGAGYGTQGHLLTLVGFTADGDPVVNDPASHERPDNDQVRTTYDRAQLERAWLTGSRGLTYVMHPVDVPLPEPPAEANW
jgi:hypothetical protein